jgi:hypothetical protein
MLAIDLEEPGVLDEDEEGRGSESNMAHVQIYHG